MEAIARPKKTKRLRLEQQQGSIDFSILLVVTALCAFGLVMIFSASYYYAQNYKGANYDSFYYLKKQALFLALGYPVMLGLTRLNYRYIDRVKGLVPWVHCWRHGIARGVTREEHRQFMAAKMAQKNPTASERGRSFTET